MTEETKNKSTGIEFENDVKKWFEDHFKTPFRKVKIKIGNPQEKQHEFDLVNETKRIAIECKCYTWTKTGNIPSAKISILNEAAFFLSFLRDYKTIIVIKKRFNSEKKETLAEYYFRTYRCLLGDTRIAEYDEETKTIFFSPEFKPYKVGDKLPWENEAKSAPEASDGSGS